MEWIRLPDSAVEISNRPVSWQEYVEFARDTRRPQPPTHRSPASPVIEISGADAEAFAAWLGARRGEAIRLPTYAEMQQLAECAENGADVRFCRPQTNENPMLGTEYLNEWLDCTSSVNGSGHSLRCIAHPDWLRQSNSHIRGAVADDEHNFITFRLARHPRPEFANHGTQNQRQISDL